MEQQNKTGFFEESPGVRSMNRIVCLFAFLVSILFGSVTLVVSSDNWVGFYLTLSFLAVGVLGKQAGKLIEMGFALKR